jgi:hypothetical protein
MYTKNANGNEWPAGIAAINDAGGSNLSALGFYTATSGPTLNEQMRIDSAGNVGIGTTTMFANSAVTVTRNQDASTRLSVRNDTSGSSAGAAVVLNAFGNSWVVECGASAKNSNALTFAVDATASPPTERMRITAAGDVGIGTSSPAFRLEAVSSGNTQVARFRTGGSDTTDIVSFERNDSAVRAVIKYTGVDGTISYGTTTNHPLAFLTNNTERARIDSAGNVAIGTTDTTNAFVTLTKANASLRLDPGSGGAVIQSVETAVAFRNLTLASGTTIFETGGSERARITSAGEFLVGTSTDAGNGLSMRPAASSGSFQLFFNRPGTSASGNVLAFLDNGTLVGTINHNNTSTTYATSSDYRLKENVAPMTGALDMVQALNPVTYTWKADGSDGQGFIAHELQEVCPDAVTGEKDAVDKDGKPVYQGVDTSFLVATLTAAIQEQQAQIEQLRAEIEILKGN